MSISPAVDDVEVAPLGPGLLGLLEVTQGGGVLARAPTALDHAVGLVELHPLMLVMVGRERVGLLLGQVVQVGRRSDAGAQGGQPAGDRDHLAPTAPGVLVAGEGAGAADVALAGASGVRRRLHRQTLGADQEVGHVASRRGREHDQTRARADRGQDVLDRGRAQQPDGAGVGLLDGLEQRVGGLVGEPVGVLDDQHLPGVTAPGERRAADQLADLVDADGELLGAGDSYPGVRTDRDLVAGGTLAATVAVALQRRGERDRSVGPARSRRPGEQPRVGHVAGDRPLQPLDHGSLADQVVPDAHRRACARSGSTRASTSRAISSIGSAGVEDEVVRGVARREAPELRAHPLVELDRLALDPVALREPGHPLGRVEVEEHRQVGSQVLGGPAGDPLEVGGVQRPARALVGEGGVDVAVGDHDLTPRECRPDDRVHVLGLVGRVEQRLGAVGQLPGRGVEHDVAHRRADRGAAGFAGQQDGVPLRGEGVAEQP